MPRYYYSGARDTVNGRKRISIFWLRKNNYLEDDVSYRHGGICWSSDGKPSGDIRFELDFTEENQSYINFIYKVKQSYEPEENYRHINYRFNLVTIPCYFGGKRWFFRCGLYKSGRYCGKRVAMLYIVGDYFGCRHCAELSYDSCNESKRFKGMFKLLTKSDKAEEYYSTLKRTHYRGKPTRKYRRYLKLNSVSESQSMLMELDLANILGKNQPKKT